MQPTVTLYNFPFGTVLKSGAIDNLTYLNKNGGFCIVGGIITCMDVF